MSTITTRTRGSSSSSYPLKTRRALSSPNKTDNKQKRLQTIESGIALNEAAANHNENNNADNNDIIDCDGAAEEKTSPDTHHELFQWQSSLDSPVICYSGTSPNLPPLHPSNTPSDFATPMNAPAKQHRTSSSYFSVDAGKHGFLSRVKTNGSAGSDSDDNGSIVFKYKPGEETPPAEYMLPASILTVYGDHVVLNRQTSLDSSISDDGEDAPAAATTSTTNVDRKRLKPPSMPLLAVNVDSLSSSPDALRLLPYHERKRLVEGQDSMQQQQQQQQQQRKTKNNAKKDYKGEGSTDKDKRKVTRSLNDTKESSPLLSVRVVENNNSNHYGATSAQNGDLLRHQQQPQQQTKKTRWFDSIVTIVSGKDLISIEDESKSYLDQGRAFLEKTEEERMKLKETLNIEELNKLNITYRDGSFRQHSRSRISSLTNALDSIASCSDVEDDTSTDIESGLSSYDEEESVTSTPTPVAANANSSARVWKYGDKSVTSSKAKKISQRDERMERERLIEEEYEYRLHALRRENERVVMRFRLFILISVAFIFAGALAFAFVVCIRILLS